MTRRVDLGATAIVKGLTSRVAVLEAGGTTPTYTDEQARDAVAAALRPGANVTITVDDAGDTITIAAAGGSSGGGDMLKADNLAGLADRSAARGNLDLGALAIKSTVNDADWSGADLSIANGGTGASSVGAMKTAFGLDLIDNTSDAAKTVLASTKLSVARLINGVAFDGTAAITINAVDSTARAPAARSIATTAPLTGGGDLSADRTLGISAATTGAPGSMSAADKTKLDGVASGATANTGTVTGVSGTAPIVSSGGSAPAISIVAATTSVAGSMSASDKAKLDGVATGATANTGTVTGVTGTAPIVSSGGTAPVISIVPATVSVAGSMSAADKAKLDATGNGATFPSSPVTNDRFYRTDRRIAYFYDGTRWLSEQIYALAFAPTDFFLPITASKGSGFRVANPWATLYDILAVDVAITRLITATSTWTYSVLRSGGTTTNTLVTSPTYSDALSSWLTSRVAINAVVTKDNIEFDGTATLNSGAASNYVLFQMTYRLIG